MTNGIRCFRKMSRTVNSDRWCNMELGWLRAFCNKMRWNPQLLYYLYVRDARRLLKMAS